jgi:hypothetical protein
MVELKYKIGDKVRIKSIDWYNENKDESGCIVCGKRLFYPLMSKYCGNIFTISDVYSNFYQMYENRLNWTDEMIEGLVEEETKPEPKFKVGDRIKWYNHTCDITSIITNESSYMYLISNFDYGEDKIFAKWVPESELTFDSDEETKTNIIEEAKTYWDSIKDAWVCPEGYIFKDENGNIINATKIVLEKKIKEYPKTYEECCKILGVDPDNYLTIRNVNCYDGEEVTIKYERDLLDKFDSLWELLICRDAYWQIAGDEMGLGEPWKPDWNDADQNRYVIAYFCGNIEKSRWDYGYSTILTFLTAEMRDEFYENFKEKIEKCKELL